MGYRRRIVHYGPGPTDFRGELADRVVAGCWFELHRQGGCGAGELSLKDGFPERDEVQVGDWIACDGDEGDRWYLGRVEERSARSPQVVRLRLQGMGVELGEVFPGGFGRDRADGTPPHLFARTDEWFDGDPDFSEQSLDVVSDTTQMVGLLLDRYVVPKTHVVRDDTLIDADSGPVWSLKFRGEETALTIVKELALRAKNAAWGVDEEGRFFFLKRDEAVQATFQEGVDVLELSSAVDFELLVNRVLLTGDFVYDAVESSQARNRPLYRWRGNYLQPASRARWGDKRLKMWVPWLRKREDVVTFLREFFRTYSQPSERYLADVLCGGTLPRPWEGDIRLLARSGEELAKGPVSTIRVRFDHVPRLRLEFGAEDPRAFWPESPTDERYEVAGPERRSGWGGEEITLTGPSSDRSSTHETDETGTSGSSTGTDTLTSSGSTSSSLASSSSRATSSDGSSDATSSEASSSDISESATSSAFTSSESSGSSVSSGFSSSSESISSETTSELSSSEESLSDHSSNGSTGRSSDPSDGESSSRSESSGGSSNESTGTTSDGSESGGTSEESGSSSAASSRGESSSDDSEGSSDSGSEGETSNGDSSSGGGSEGESSEGNGSASGGGSNHSGMSGSSESGTSESGEASSNGSSSGGSGSDAPSSEAGNSNDSGSDGSASGSSASGDHGCVYKFMLPPGSPTPIWVLFTANCPPGHFCQAPTVPGTLGELRRVPCD
jgi:hypothetical protein